MNKRTFFRVSLFHVVILSTCAAVLVALAHVRAIPNLRGQSSDSLNAESMSATGPGRHGSTTSYLGPAETHARRVTGPPAPASTGSSEPVVAQITHVLPPNPVQDLSTWLSDTEQLARCEAAAKRIIQLLRSTLAPDDPGPVVVGGIGESGTRGVELLLSQLGVDLGYLNFSGIEDSLNVQRDTLRLRRATVVPCLPNVSSKDQRDPLASALLPDLHTGNWSRRLAVETDRVLSIIGAQVVGNMTLEAHAAVRRDIKVDGNLHPRLLYGMKHPRTAPLLPYFKLALGKQFRFVHVLRDGRDVAMGQNQHMFMQLCSTLFNETCASDLPTKLRFWARFNMRIANWARRELGAGQYIAVRSEDFVRGDMKSFLRLARFVGLTESDARQRLTPAFISETMSHLKAYEGRKWTAYQAKRFAGPVARNKLVQNANARFGYNMLNATTPWTRSDVSVLDLETE